MHSKEFLCGTVNLVKTQLCSWAKLPSEYLYFHLHICSVLNLDRRSFLLLCAAVNERLILAETKGLFESVSDIPTEDGWNEELKKSEQLSISARVPHKN